MFMMGALMKRSRNQRSQMIGFPYLWNLMYRVECFSNIRVHMHFHQPNDRLIRNTMFFVGREHHS